ncbi:MAG: nucleotidyltransferase domain-containing protein [Candidatus Krumholzibacteria bacterium]|nr:nucleotidyltransferase domain-containing protein [Candidatus Krumholzibacteria bacterium]MDH4336393.1 nucleotidyltransferase domain-containing protein [Candidatus Krumholzibacteria bacterium]MDH5269518.1 nucleotidyltransferase domain-containing protein [Candidatus Krumholzibacteria bacterium]
MLRRRAGTIAESIVRRAPAGSVALIFAGGSLARGAVWACDVAGTLEVYSDIDLYVVVEDPSFVAAVQAAARRAIAEVEAGREPGVLFLRGVDVGVYTREDLRAQPVRPGTADLGTNHLVLYGDPGRLPGMLPAPEEMDGVEALYLLENRAWDAWRPPRGDASRERLRRVLSLKLDLDIAVAHMIVAGAGVASITNPAPALRAPATFAIDEDVRAAGVRAIDARCDPGALADLEENGESPLQRVGRAWLALAPWPLDAPGADAAALFAARCAQGRRLANARQWVRTAGCAGVAKPRALLAVWRCSARSPRSVLRLHPLAQVLLRGDALEVHAANARRVTAALGFGLGTLDERVRAAHAAIS